MKTYVVRFISNASKTLLLVAVLLVFFWLTVYSETLASTPLSLTSPVFASQPTITSAAVLSLTQDNTTVNATGAGLTDFAYLKSSFYVNCRNTTLAYTDGQSATGLSNQQWVCFKAKDAANNTWKYANLQVDLSLTTYQGSAIGDSYSCGK